VTDGTFKMMPALFEYSFCRAALLDATSFFLFLFKYISFLQQHLVLLGLRERTEQMKLATNSAELH
jgi:hypothetical protein